jgi:transglutaminase-like putative cysteine protease
MGVMQRYMQESIFDPNVQAIALQAAPDKDPITLRNWILYNFPYKPDPEDAESLIKPAKAIEYLINGNPILYMDCDDLSLLTTTLLNVLGFTSRIAIADVDFDNEEDHAWSEFLDQNLNIWIPVDSTTKDFPVGWTYQCQKKHEVYV